MFTLPVRYEPTEGGNNNQVVDPKKVKLRVVLTDHTVCCGGCGGRFARCLPGTRVTTILWVLICLALVLVGVLVATVMLMNDVENL